MQTIHTIMPWLLRVVGLVLLVVGALNVLARRLPAENVTRWERTRPRLANALRFLRAVGPDLDKALPVLWLLVTGKPWPAVLARAAQAPRVTTVPPPPVALALVALVGLGGVLQGCPLPPPDCAPGSAGQPMPTKMFMNKHGHNQALVACFGFCGVLDCHCAHQFGICKSAPHPSQP
jgi:hypothetical protein